MRVKSASLDRTLISGKSTAPKGSNVCRTGHEVVYPSFVESPRSNPIDTLHGSHVLLRLVVAESDGTVLGRPLAGRRFIS